MHFSLLSGFLLRTGLVVFGLASLTSCAATGIGARKKKDQDQIYDPSCIDNPSCAPLEREAVVYDYTGSVYVQGPEKGRFDGRLSFMERGVVEKKFGHLASAGRRDVESCLSSARRKFFEKSFPQRTQKPYCADADFRAVLKEYSDRRLGEAVVLAGAHGCFEDTLALFGQVETRMAAAADKALFFIELSSHLNPGEPETIFLISIARSLTIPIVDPIIYPSDLEFLQAAEERYGTTPLDWAAFTVVSNLFYLEDLEKGFSLEQLRNWVNAAVDQFGLSGQEILTASTAILQFRDAGQGRVSVEFDHERYHRLHEQFKILSNLLGVKRVREALQREKRGFALFQMGKAHLPIPEEVYQ